MFQKEKKVVLMVVQERKEKVLIRPAYSLKYYLYETQLSRP